MGLLLEWLPDYARGTGRETLTEEIANSMTHLFGLLASSVGTYFLVIGAIVYRHSWHHVIGLVLFCICMVMLYSFSTLYHTICAIFPENDVLIAQFRILDHVAIFWMIAGSYSPLVLILLVRTKAAPMLSFVMLTVVWSSAIAGTILKIFYFDSVTETTSNILYLAMGWTALLGARPFFLQAPRKILIWIMVGGAAYSGGVFFLVFDDLHFNHSIWHLFVVAGTASHFLAIVLTMFLESHIGSDGSMTSKVKLSTKTALRMLVDLKRPTKPTPMVTRNTDKQK